MIEPEVADKVLSTKGAAALLGVSVRTMERWRTVGEGPAYRRIAGGVYYSRRACEEFLRSLAARIA